MSEITELETRISAALGQISAALPDLVRKADADAMAALQKQLIEERAAAAQLEARVSAIKEKQQEQAHILEEKKAGLLEQVARQDARLTRMKMVNQHLLESNAALRDANRAGVGDAHLINKAMLAELEALRALRDAEQEEVEALLAELKPLIEMKENA